MTTTAKSPALAEPVARGNRRCSRCGCVLSAYNTDEYCGACARAALPPAEGTPRVPVRVWADPEVREALAAWNFGQVSRLVRQRGSIRQEDVAQLTGLSQGFLSMLESGARRLTSIDRIVDFLDGLAVPADLVRVPRRRPVPRSATIPAQAAPAAAEGRRGRPRWEGPGEDAGPWTAEQALAALTDAIAAAGLGGPAAAARPADLSAYAQRWAAAAPYPLERDQPGAAELPAELLDQLQGTTDLLRRMDGEHGGGGLAQAGTAHLAVVVGLWRNGRYDAQTGRRLATIAADAAGQAGWYQLDAARTPAALRLLLAALRAAHAAQEARVGAAVLVRLAVGAYLAGRPEQVVEVARLARERTRDLDAPALHATLLTWEARGHAKLGRRRETLRALGLAAELCIRGRGEDEPHWLEQLAEGDIHAQAGSCHFDLGDHRQAVASLLLAADTLRPTQVRTRGLVLARAAAARLRLGDPHGAFETANQAKEIASRLRSACLDDQVRALTEALPGLAHGRA